MPPESILRDFSPILALFFEMAAAPRQIYRPRGDVDFSRLFYEGNQRRNEMAFLRCFPVCRPPMPLRGSVRRSRRLCRLFNVLPRLRPSPRQNRFCGQKSSASSSFFVCPCFPDKSLGRGVLVIFPQPAHAFF